MHDITKRNAKGSGQPKGRKQRGAKKSSSEGFQPVPLAALSTRVISRTLGIPKYFQGKFRQGIQGYLGAGVAATGQATVYGNSFFQPFATLNSITTGWALNLTDASSTAGNFAGYTMMAAGYASCRVLRSQLKVTAVNGLSGDTMNIWIEPIPNANTATTKYQVALGNAGTKAMMITTGCRPLTIVSAVNPCEVLGYTMAEYRASGFAAASMVGNPAGSQLTAWQVSYATLDGLVTSGSTFFTSN